MKKRILYTLAIALVLGGVALCGGLYAFKAGAVREPGSLYLPSRSTYEALLDSLKPRIGHHLAFDLYARRLNLA